MSALLLRTLTLLLLSLAATGLKFEVRPTRIEIGLTPQFNLNCSFNHGTDLEISSLVSLFVYRSKDTAIINYQEIASVNTFSGIVNNVVHDNATISGVINNQGLSFLTMEWRYPDDEVSGVYKCVANGVDGTGHPISVMSTSLVTSEIPDIKQLVQVVRNLMMNKDYTQDNTCTSGCWQGRFDQMMKARFEISPLYNGHRYLLSKGANLASAAVSKESCELYGGYLAEIDNEDEMLFVKNFLNSPKTIDYIFVLVSGTDEEHEKQWVFDRSGRNLTYTKWISGHPLTSVAYSCLYLHRDYAWTMDDYLCFETAANFNSRYLCELPDQ